MRLVIAEKPSVAKSLAAVLGAATRKDGYLEGGGWLVSWCLGHLAGLADAATYNPDYAKWRYDDLPILPESWRFTIAKDKRDQFDVLRTLLRREDVTEVVNACDAGREGELIFRTVYCLAGCQKPMKRLWISSMEDSAIRRALPTCAPARTMTGCTRQPSAGPRPTGWWVSTPPDCSRCCTTAPSISGGSCPRRWPSSSSGRQRSTPSSRCRSILWL